VSREINVAVRSLDSNRVKHLIQLLGTSQGRKATLNKRLVVVHPSEDRAGAFLNLSSQRDVAPKGFMTRLLLHCMSPVVTWWTAPVPGIEVP
jgi:hypothetical protein